MRRVLVFVLFLPACPRCPPCWPRPRSARTVKSPPGAAFLRAQRRAFAAGGDPRRRGASRAAQGHDGGHHRGRVVAPVLGHGHRQRGHATDCGTHDRRHDQRAVALLAGGAGGLPVDASAAMNSCDASMWIEGETRRPQPVRPAAACAKVSHQTVPCSPGKSGPCARNPSARPCRQSWMRAAAARAARGARR